MFGKFLERAPLWQHANPEQRLTAIAQFAPNAPELFLLIADTEPSVQRAALERISDASALLPHLTGSNGEQVRERLFKLLATAEPAVQAAALERLGGEPEMIALACEAPTMALRQAAAHRVHSLAGLKQIADAARQKDHGVAKAARDRVDALETQAGREHEALTLCESLESLATAHDAILSRVVEIDRRYASLQPGAPLAQRFAAARNAIHARLEHEQASQRERAAWLHDFAQFRLIGQSASISPDTLNVARTQFDGLQQRAFAHPDLLDRLQASGAADAIAALGAALVAQAQADALLLDFAPAVENSARLVEFEDRWAAIPEAGRDAQRQQQFADLVSGHRRQLAQQERVDVGEQSSARNQLHTLLAKAEEALAAGEIAQAAALRDEMKPLRGRAGELPKPTNQRLGRLSQQLGDLLRWQAFGNATQREQMCSQAEEIPELGLAIPELAKRVQALRDGWKQLDQTQAPAPRALWERFNAACEIAYAPAGEHFAKQAEQRKEALVQREGMIKDITDFATLALTPNPDVANWAPDWKAIGNHLANADSQWRSAGHVDRKKSDAIEAKWKAATQPLRAGVSNARNDEVQQREKLIAQVSGLVGSDGKLASGAVAKVKDAQVQWQSRAKAFPMPRKQEQTLWETFRNACNGVFDALGAEKTARQSAFNDAGKQKLALIERFTTLANEGNESAMRAAISEAPREWAKLGDAGRDSERKLSDQFDRTLQSIRSNLQSKERGKSALQLETLVGLAQAVAAIEAAAVAGSEGTAALAALDWNRAELLPPVWRQKLATRKQFAEKALSDSSARAQLGATVARDAAAINEPLIDLELALNIESGSLSPQEKMQRQVARLANRLKSGSAMPDKERLASLCALSVGSAPALYERMLQIARRLSVETSGLRNEPVARRHDSKRK